ncbi:MAG: hypothetical protein ACOY3L_09895 [Pseudomonadota bacterium]
MEHKTLNAIRSIAGVIPFASQRMTRREKLERWATVLERHTGKLRPLIRVEFLAARERMQLRGDDTPLAVAYGDPVLREEGLASDRLGDAMSFFELTQQEAHCLLCDCHYNGTMTTDVVAARLRSLAAR